MLNARDSRGTTRTRQVARDGDPLAVELRLPAGYTYFGQFVDHDITFDPIPAPETPVPPPYNP
jgi:hypothetical protein